MPRLIYTEDAGADFFRLREFLQLKNPAASNRAANVIVEAINRLKLHPKLGKPKEQGYRELGVKFGSGGYLVLYRLHDDNIIITAIKHHKEADYPFLPESPL